MDGMLTYPSQRDVRLAEPVPSWLQEWDTNNFIQNAQSRRGMFDDQMQGADNGRSLRWLLHILSGGRPSRDLWQEPPVPVQPSNPRGRPPTPAHTFGFVRG